MSDIELATAFDYAPLGNSAETVKAIAKSINQKMRTTAGAIIAIGRELRTAKGILGASVFGHWIEAEFGFTDRTARNYIAVVTQLGEYEDRISSIPASTLYLLASQSVPQEAIETVIARTEAGETVTREEAREIIADSKDYAETVSTDEADDEPDQPDIEFDEPTNGVRDPAEFKSSAPKPNVATIWREIEKHIDAASNLFTAHARDCDEAFDVKRLLEDAAEKFGYYVRNVEAV
jgi:hypothetical protein